ncbi:hypothetical protein G6F56_006640 [Rhizopus delemar]|nr:hypothetical protein G6F56_006640 [Rhizopus delemar]
MTSERLAEDERLYRLCRDQHPEVTLLQIKPTISEFYDKDGILLEKPRAVNKYNVYSQQEKKKADYEASENKEHSAAHEERLVLNPQSLSKSYKARAKVENDNLLRLVAESKKDLKMPKCLKWYKVAGVTGRKTANSSKCKTFVVGEHFERVNFESWSKQAERTLRPKHNAIEKKRGKETHATIQRNNKEVSYIKNKLREFLNQQCDTMYVKMPWTKLGKSGTTFTPGDIVVENWPIASTLEKDVNKCAAVVKLLASLEAIKFSTSSNVAITSQINMP